MPKTRRPRYKDLRLSQLRSFCDVCRLGGFRAAGQALDLTTPAVWEQVRALETHYGVELMERKGRAVYPTAAGTMLFEALRRMLAEFDSTYENIRQQTGALPERITLVASLRVQMHEILRALRAFEEQHPSVGLRIRHVDSGEVASLILNGEADLGVMLKPGPLDRMPAAIAFDHVTDMEFLLVAPPGHPLIAKRRLRINDIVEYPLVLGRPEAFSRRRFEEVLHSQNLDASARVVLETSSSSLTLAAVHEGLGVGIVACMPNGVLTAGLGVRSLRRWFGTAQVVFARRAGGQLPPVQQKLADAIRDSIVQGSGRRSGGRSKRGTPWR